MHNSSGRCEACPFLGSSPGLSLLVHSSTHHLQNHNHFWEVEFQVAELLLLLLPLVEFQELLLLLPHALRLEGHKPLE